MLDVAPRSGGMARRFVANVRLGVVRWTRAEALHEGRETWRGRRAALRGEREGRHDFARGFDFGVANSMDIVSASLRHELLQQNHTTKSHS